MIGIEGSNQSHRPATRRRGPFQDALQPGDLTHHALLRDLPPQVLPWTIRELRRRLYEGRTSGTDGSQRIAMRQGFPLWWSATLFALGWFFLAGSIVTGSDLGRSFQLLDGGGGTAQAAAPVLFHPSSAQAMPFLLWGGVALLGLSFWMSLCPRKHFFLVAQKNDSDLLDLWVSGTSWRHEQQFNREFQDLARRIDLQRRTIQDVPQASHQGP